MTKENTEWKEATTSEVVKLEPGDRIEGKYVSLEKSALYPDSYALVIETNDGSVTTFVNEVARNLIEHNNIQPDTEIALIFVGMKKNLAGNREYKNYQLLYK